jgi:hypothetical protein
MVDKLSIRSCRPAGVADSTTDEEATGGVEEGEPACLRFFPHDRDDLLDAFGSLAFVRPPCIHLGCLGAAGTRRRWLDANALQESREFGARAGWRDGGGFRWRKARLQMSRVCRVVNVDCPLVAVLRDDAWHYLVKCVAASRGHSTQMMLTALNHGSGFNCMEKLKDNV